MQNQQSPLFEMAKPEEATRWYHWIAKLKMKSKDKPDWINNWNLVQDDPDIFWLIGVIAGTAPLGKPIQLQKAIAVVRRSLGTTKYVGEKEAGDEFPPDEMVRRKLSKDEIGNKKIYCAVSTEFAWEGKYPAVGVPMKDLAKQIIDHENPKNMPAFSPPAFVEFNGESLVGSALAPYAVTDTIKSITFERPNIFALPEGTGAGGFYDYVVKIDPKHLTEKENILRFGVNGRFFSYAVEYSIM